MNKASDSELSVIVPMPPPVPAQQPAAKTSTDPQDTKKARDNRAVLLPDAFACDSMLGNSVPPRGVEESPNNTGITPSSGESGTESGTVGARFGVNDAGLMLTIETWPSLSDRQREAILAIIRGSK